MLKKEPIEKITEAVEMRIPYELRPLSQIQVDYLQRKSQTGMAAEFLFELANRSAKEISLPIKAPYTETQIKQIMQIQTIKNHLHQIAATVLA